MIGSELDTSAIQRELQNLSAELRMKAVRAGIVNVAKLDVSLMKSTAPVETGDLKSAVNRRQLSKSNMSKLGISTAGDTLAVVVGPNKKVKGRYFGRLANITEGGAKPHVIVPRQESNVQALLRSHGLRGNKSMILANGQGFFAKRVNHPGTRPDPFMKESYDQSAGQVEGLFYSGVRDYLNRVRV